MEKNDGGKIIRMTLEEARKIKGRSNLAKLLAGQNKDKEKLAAEKKKR